MTPTLFALVGVLVGVVGHKGWRVAWRVRRHPVSWGDALADEFAPPEPEGADRKKARTPLPSEIG